MIEPRHPVAEIRGVWFSLIFSIPLWAIISFIAYKALR